VGAAEALLQRTGLKPDDIDVVITTCSIYCPVPSLPSIIVNHFKMRPSVETYSLSGMGCANGVVAINLVRDLLKVAGWLACTWALNQALQRCGAVRGDRSLCGVLSEAWQAGRVLLPCTRA
jgi:hypothetical protein